MTSQLSSTVTRDCPVACLAPLLTQPTLDALASGLARDDDSPATVGQLIELFEQNHLTNIFNVGSGRAGEIRWALVTAELIDPNAMPRALRWMRKDTNGNGHHQVCSRHT